MSGIGERVGEHQWTTQGPGVLEVEYSVIQKNDCALSVYFGQSKFVKKQQH
jgi:hypothetical protein